MQLNFFMLIMAFVFLISNDSFARGSGGGHSHSGSSRSSHSNYVSRASRPSYVNKASKSSVSVKGYYKKNGKYVAAHKRSKPDKTKKNNWSTKGNTNPYTGKLGTKNNE